MRQLMLTDEQFTWIQGLIPVGEAVTDGEFTETAALGVIIERGFRGAIADVIAPAGEETNTEALLQLAMLYPKEVCGFIGCRVGLGDDLRRKRQPRDIGF